MVIALPGAVPVGWGGFGPLGTTVPWGDSPRRGRAAHGPLHRAVTSPPRDGCWVFCLVLLVSGVGMLFGLSPFRT